jgi:hypothetical protein
MRLVRETASTGDLTHRPIGNLYQRLGPLQPRRHQIFPRRQTRGTAEDTGKMPTAQMNGRRQLLDGDTRTEMVFNILIHFTHLISRQSSPAWQSRPGNTLGVTPDQLHLHRLVGHRFS